MQLVSCVGAAVICQKQANDASGSKHQQSILEESDILTSASCRRLQIISHSQGSVQKPDTIASPSSPENLIADHWMQSQSFANFA